MKGVELEMQECGLTGPKQGANRLAIVFVAALAILAALNMVGARPSYGATWCGGRLITSGDRHIKDRMLVSLPGRLVLKSYPDWKTDGDILQWILILDYETPVLTDIAGSKSGGVIKIDEMQLYRLSKAERKRLERLRDMHVLVTGVLNTSYFAWNVTDVYMSVSRIEPIRPVGCDGKPVSRY